MGSCRALKEMSRDKPLFLFFFFFFFCVITNSLLISMPGVTSTFKGKQEDTTSWRATGRFTGILLALINREEPLRTPLSTLLSALSSTVLSRAIRLAPWSP